MTNSVEPVNVPKTQGVPYYKPSIGPRLQPATRELFQVYSGLADSEILNHLHSIRDRAWPIAHYPCVGEWCFLLPGISRFTTYQAILSRVKAGASVLDLGCCFAQDLRRLAADGAPTENMYASDLHEELWDLSFDLFRDRKSMEAHFIKADIFEPPEGLLDLEGKIDIVFMCGFLHLFSWENQIEAIRRVVEMSRPGTWVVGLQIGTVGSLEGKMPPPWNAMFLHNVESFEKIWQLVGEETSTKWTVNAALVDMEAWGMEKEDFEWMPASCRGFNFMVTRQNLGEESKPSPPPL